MVEMTKTMVMSRSLYSWRFVLVVNSVIKVKIKTCLQEKNTFQCSGLLFRRSCGGHTQ